MTLPPLHPRCRCAIAYREVGTVGNVGGNIRRLTPELMREIRESEEKAVNTKTDADFGFKKMRGSPDWAKEIRLTNPINKRYGHTPNCQRCVVAHEVRMRGYDVIARPSWGQNDTTRIEKKWINAFASPSDFVKCIGKTSKDVIKSAEELMRSFGEGSRAIIVFKWDKSLVKSDGGHVIVAQCKEKGIVVFGDPQSGKIAAARELYLADFNEGILLIRVDNLSLTNEVKRCCMNKE